MRIVKALAVAMLAAALIALAGCSVSHESSTTVSTSVTDGDTTETTTTEVSTTAGTDGVSTETTTETSGTLDVAEWEYGWIGVSDTDSKVFYSESPAGDEAILVVQDARYDELVSCIGSLSMDEDGISTVEDLDGTTFNFELLGQDGDTVTLDLGDEFGTVVLDYYEMPDFLDELRAVDEHGQVFAE